MKIDIQIHDATPEEAQRLLIGMQMTDAVLGKPPAKVQNPTHKEQVCTKLKRAVPEKVKKSHPEHGYWNKWQIPFRSDTQKEEYQRAYALCRKYGKKYPEALKLKEAEDVKQRQKKPENVEKGTKAPKKAKDGKLVGARGISGHQIPCLYCGKEYNSHGMHLHVKYTHPDKYEEWAKIPDRLHHGIHQEAETGGKQSGGQTGSADGGHKVAPDIKTKAPQRHQTPRLPFHLKKDAPVHNIATTEDTVTTLDGEDPEHGRFRDEESPEAMSSPPEDDVKIAGSEGLSDVMPESNPTNLDRRNLHLKAGNKVKHTSGSQLFFGTGTVKRTNLKSGDILVDFGNGIEWLPEKELTLVTA
jgi:hypothetical protein